MNTGQTFQGLGLAPSIGPNRIGIFTWRWEQSQLPKRSGLVLERLMMDQVQKNNNAEYNAPSLEHTEGVLSA
jgi:hypothetical protein